MKKQKQGSGRFQTHIPEPRWQVIVSVIVVALLAVIEVLVLLKVI